MCSVLTAYQHKKAILYDCWFDVTPLHEADASGVISLSLSFSYTTVGLT